MVEACTFSLEVEQLAIKSVEVLGLEFGGVDIIMDAQERPYLMEVNFPCYFPRAQLLTGRDIASMMVEFLMKKSKTIVY